MTIDLSKYKTGSTTGGVDLSKYKLATPAAPQQNLAEKLWSSIASAPGQIGQAFNQGIDETSNAINEITKTSQASKTPIRTGIQEGVNALSGVATAVSAPLAPVMAPVGKAIDAYANFATSDSNPFLAGGSKQIQDFANSETGQKVANTAEGLSKLGNVAGTMLGLNQVATGVPKFVDTIKNIDYKGLVTPSEQTQNPINIEKVNDLYNRAIRPTVSGKSTSAQVTKANTQTVEGLKAIADNKPNLSFTNADGETITGASPKSVDHLSQAIGQTKSSIFKQYDALAQQAGEKGVTVEAPKIASELDPVINSKSLQLANPSAIEYAKSIQERFNAAGEIDAQTAQDVIQHYNDSLKAFYRNPSYDTASKAGIDALIANKLRSALDEGITGATGEQYQALKNQYGALSSMEKDVAHRSIVWARQNKVSLPSTLANIGSGAELVRGLITMNPADIAISGVIKGIQKYADYLNNPDVGVSKIFSEIDRSSLPSTGSTLEPTGLGQAEKPLPTNIPPTSITDKVKAVYKKVKTEGQKGFVKLPLREKIPADDLATMSDFTSMLDGSYKPSAAEAHNLEIAAKRLHEKYAGGKMPKTLQGLANDLGKMLEASNFKPYGTKGAEQPRFPKGTSDGGKFTSNELLPLAREATKYKTLEEFLKKQSVVYHGSNAKFDNFDFKKTGLASGEKPLHGLEGAWFVDNKAVASGYGKNIKEASIDTTNFHTVDAKGKTLNNFRDELWDAKKLVKDQNKNGLIVKNLIDNADYSKNTIGTHIFVVNKNAIKTKSQFTELWKKANKK